MGQYTTFEEQVLYGLEHIDAGRQVELSLREAVYLHQLLGKIHDFFEQPRHYPDIEDIHQFLGDAEHGALKLVAKAYKNLQDVIPADIHQELAEGETFDHPNPPYYGLD